MSIQIHSIRDRSEGIKISYKTENGTSSVNAGAMPSEDFVAALDALKPIALKICGLPDTWKDLIKMIGLTLKPVGDEGNCIVVFVAKRDMVQGSPFNFSSPQRFLLPTEEDGGMSLVLDDEDRTAVNRLRDAAIVYVRDYLDREVKQLRISLDGEIEVETTPVDDEQPALALS